jgi:hypothetical protein
MVRRCHRGRWGDVLLLWGDVRRHGDGVRRDGLLELGAAWTEEPRPKGGWMRTRRCREIGLGSRQMLYEDDMNEAFWYVNLVHGDG